MSSRFELRPFLFALAILAPMLGGCPQFTRGGGSDDGVAPVAEPPADEAPGEARDEP
jgi:hypothetical protein